MTDKRAGYRWKASILNVKFDTHINVAFTNWPYSNSLGTKTEKVLLKIFQCYAYSYISIPKCTRKPQETNYINTFIIEINMMLCQPPQTPLKRSGIFCILW